MGFTITHLEILLLDIANGFDLIGNSLKELLLKS